jgi:radical SAM additional 4Fe4S-binding domain
MCDVWRHPTESSKEISPRYLEKLPALKFINITGGEPFIRDDLADIIEVLYKKTPRIVISTSGWFSDKVIQIAKRFPSIGIRISIEGMSQVNDELRGRAGGFDNGLRTLLELKKMGLKDIGFGQTIGNENYKDVIPLYRLSKYLGFEFATAAIHNSFYFHKNDNEIVKKEEITSNLSDLVGELMLENNPKSWFRALFNLGLINYVNGGKRMLPCEAGEMNFFVDPYGDIYPCNGMEERIWKESMGNIMDSQSFEEIWESERAERVRTLVRECPKNCWMVGTASPVMHKYVKYPAEWAVRNKLRTMIQKKPCYDIPHWDVGQSALQGNRVWPRE